MTSRCRWPSRIALLSLIALSGCARLALMQSDDPLADFQQARSEQEYERALYIAEHLDTEHPDHDRIEAKLPELRNEIEAFEQQTIRRAESLAKEKSWDEVWQLMARAMDQWRPSPALREARQRLREREQRQRRETLGELLLAEAQWRLTRTSLADQLAHYTDGASANRHKDWRRRNQTLARKLVAQARWFAEREDWGRVHAYLQSAKALHANRVPEELLARAREQQSAASRRSRAQRAQQQRKQADHLRERARGLLQRYLETGKLEDLLALRQLTRNQSGNQLSEELTARVEIISRERFRSAMSEGDARYAQGDYRAAQSIWQNIQPLAPPDSQLPEKLERVERVLSKLENLKKE